MKNIVKYISIVFVFASMIACEKLDPIDENRLDIDYIRSNPAAAEGLLINGYLGLINQYSFSEAATDDAVNNKLDNSFKRIALGELSAQYITGISRWDKYEEVLYINKFLEVIEPGEVVWKIDEEMNQLFQDRLKGEALALRALYHFYILQAHAGVGTSGQLLGIPYVSKFLEANADFNLPRLSFQASVDSIMADFDAAIELLPTDYYTEQTPVIDDKYSAYDVNKYKEVNGEKYNLRISGRIVKALKARLALFAASPSFLDGEGGYYEMAADLAGDLLSDIGGVSGLSSNGAEFYTFNTPGEIIASGEMLWREQLGSDNTTYESRCFPPSVNGKGEINPTHNLVMAFPMKDGFPATEANGFDPQNPYANRDPRLAKYIVVNGSSIGGGTINSGLGGGVDRLDSIPEQSTTTGYYLRKLLHPGVRINDSGSSIKKKHYDVFFRYTELFLIFAEAANEIGGPDYTVDGISARDVIGAIRQRAGITQPDAYLASITEEDAMRELIRNERRLELCFEGHRFWDLRRWGLPLTEAAKGYFQNGIEYVNLPSVEIRNYPSHATYMPIPYNEVLKYSELEQNNGW